MATQIRQCAAVRDGYLKIVILNPVLHVEVYTRRLKVPLYYRFALWRLKGRQRNLKIASLYKLLESLTVMFHNDRVTFHNDRVTFHNDRETDRRAKNRNCHIK